MKFEVTITGVTTAIGQPDDRGVRRATIQLYDGDTPIDGAQVERAIPASIAGRSRVGDRWTVSLQREVAL